MTPTTIDSLTLTTDQEQALTGFSAFLVDPEEKVFVLSGYSGCGKSTLVRVILDRIPSFMKMAKLINPSQYEYPIELAATTNKAAENLSQILGRDVKTVHSLLGLRVVNDFRNNTSDLDDSGAKPLLRTLLFIDEASFIDSRLLQLIFQYTHQCKVVFVGDPAQLAPVKSSNTPVFAAGFNGAALTQVVRQAEGNPIIDLSTKFRHAVNTGEFPAGLKLDGSHVRHLDRSAFNQAIIDEFTRKDWAYSDSKILAWTNKRVVEFNNFVRQNAKGDPQFQPGDYAVCNSYVQIGRQSIKTDQLVHIAEIGGETEVFQVKGRHFTIEGRITVFVPNALKDKQERIKRARSEDMIDIVRVIESAWADLRAVYAQTVNKSQGSTYDKVFIDLDDIGRCNSADTMARMLYVAVSRARTQVTLTGDIA